MRRAACWTLCPPGLLGLLGCLSLVCAPGCANDFEPQSTISKLRVLAVQAEPAELLLRSGGPAPSTTLRALVADPGGDLGAASSFALCTVQGRLPPPDLACPGADGLALDPAGPASARLDLGDPRFAPLTQALAAGAGGADAAAALAKGVPVLVGFDVGALQGFATVPLRTDDGSGRVNHNPTLAEVQADGQPLAADGSTALRAGVKVKLVPIPAADVKEPTPEGPERLVFSFYATKGGIASLRSTDTTATGEAGTTSVDYTPPAGATAARIWVVVRDNRGGVGWLVRDIAIRP